MSALFAWMAMIIIEWILVLLGHTALACVLFNHVHAYSSPNRKIGRFGKPTEKLVIAFAVLPIPFLIYVLVQQSNSKLPNDWSMGDLYLWVCKCIAVYFVLRWFYRTITRRLPTNTRLVSSERFLVQRETESNLLHGLKANILNWVPGNQVTEVQVENWEFRFSELPGDLNGVKVCHLSDLHFTGLVDQRYFARVVELIDQNQPDLIFLTGDIIDIEACLDWIPEVLSRLTARFGVYFVLGNHDKKIRDQKDYRSRLNAAGLKHVADGNWHQVAIGASKLLIGGNELPWYQPKSELPASPTGENCFSILLSHSPDQIGWAVKRNFDLMFAGHTHGGQIRLPLVGPIIAPSRYGIKYASGTFRIRNTLMHVSRGISGDEPIRINCPPELGFFTLLRETSRSGSPQTK